MRLLDITPRNMAKYLSLADPVFVDLRNLIHFIDSIRNGHPDRLTDDELRSAIKQYWHCKEKKRVLGRLDSIKIRSMFKEQESRVGGGRSDSDDPHLPLVFPDEGGW